VARLVTINPELKRQETALGFKHTDVLNVSV
jgi:hypothetical protein